MEIVLCGVGVYDRLHCDCLIRILYVGPSSHDASWATEVIVTVQLAEIFTVHRAHAPVMFRDCRRYMIWTLDGRFAAAAAADFKLHNCRDDVAQIPKYCMRMYRKQRSAY
jgi:hypothetical protein